MDSQAAPLDVLGAQARGNEIGAPIMESQDLGETVRPRGVQKANGEPIVISCPAQATEDVCEGTGGA